MPSSCLSVRLSARKKFAYHGTNFHENWCQDIFSKICRENSSLILTRRTGTLQEDLRTVMTASRLILIRIRSVWDEGCTENQNTFYVQWLFFFENRAVYEIMWKSIVDPDRPQITIWRTSIACWIPKATNTHSECVILITFPLQQFLHEHDSMLRYTYIACLVIGLLSIYER